MGHHDDLSVQHTLRVRAHTYTSPSLITLMPRSAVLAILATCIGVAARAIVVNVLITANADATTTTPRRSGRTREGDDGEREPDVDARAARAIGCGLACTCTCVRARARARTRARTRRRRDACASSEVRSAIATSLLVPSLAAIRQNASRGGTRAHKRRRATADECPPSIIIARRACARTRTHARACSCAYARKCPARRQTSERVSESTPNFARLNRRLRRGSGERAAATSNKKKT